MKHGARGPSWSLYMIRCADGSLYTGIAMDVGRRLAEHEGGGARGARYLRGRGPLEVVLERVVGTRERALRLEARVKRLARARKERLILGDGLLDRLIEGAGRAPAPTRTARSGRSRGGRSARPR